RRRRAGPAARDADRHRDDGHPAADLPLVRPPAAEPAARLDPLAREVQPRQLGGRGRPVGLGAERGLGSDRHAERPARAAAARERHLRHPGVPRLPEVDLTTRAQGDRMFIPLTAALSWPQASVYITAIAACGVVVAVLVWSIFRTGQTAIATESGRKE